MNNDVTRPECDELVESEDLDNGFEEQQKNCSVPWRITTDDANDGRLYNIDERMSNFRPCCTEMPYSITP